MTISNQGGLGQASILGQSALSATTLTDVYTCTSPVAETHITAIFVCNRGAATTFRVAFAESGAADATKQYLYYDTPIQANDTFLLDCNMGMLPTDVIRAYAGSANISVAVFGTEMM